MSRGAGWAGALAICRRAVAVVRIAGDGFVGETVDAVVVPGEAAAGLLGGRGAVAGGAEPIGVVADGGCGRAGDGASPCTGDHKIHYLTGVEQDSPENMVEGENLTLEAGEYAVVRVDDPGSLRETWIYLLHSWLPASGRKERRAPEFERYTSMSEAGVPVGPVEVWIPLEPVEENRAPTNSH